MAVVSMAVVSMVAFHPHWGGSLLLTMKDKMMDQRCGIGKLINPPPPLA